LAVFTVWKKLLKLFKKPYGTLESDPENVSAFQTIAAKFLDFVIEREPALRRYFIEEKTTPEKERKGNRNLVFRPVGLELLARLYVHFHQGGKLPLFAWALENLQWQNPEGVWDGTVLYRGKIKPKAKASALNYVLYLLHELPDSSCPKLLTDLRDLRNDDDYELPERKRVPAKLLKTGGNGG
jgi:hypothetical protein